MFRKRLTFLVVCMVTVPIVGQAQDEGAGGADGGDSRRARSTRVPARLKFRVLNDASDKGKGQLVAATRTRVFEYRVGSFKPKEKRRGRASGMGDMGMGGGSYEEMGYGGLGGEGYAGDSYGGGYGGGDGGGGYGEDYGAGDYGMEGGLGGYGGGMGPGMGSGMGGSSGPRSLTIRALIFDNDLQQGRPRIELFIEPRPSDNGAPMGMGGMMGGPGIAAPPGMVGSGGAAGMGGFDEEFEFEPAKLFRFKSESPGETRRPRMPAAEHQIVTNVIKLQIWKKDAIEYLNRNKSDKQKLAEVEKRLRSILTEEYETQLARQEVEVSNIEAQILALRRELQRRQAAKARVVDVQLGKIVLEAQGLLGD